MSKKKQRVEWNCKGFLGYKTKYCRICGISGPTKCTEQANCLNVSLDAERRMK